MTVAAGKGGTTKRPAPTFEDHLSKKKPVTRRVPICLDPELGEALVDAETKVSDCLDTVQSNQRNKIVDAAADRALEDARAVLEKARAAAAAETVEVVFQSIGRTKWDELLDRHPASAKEVEKAKQDGLPVPQYDEDTLQIEAIALCAVEPVMTVDQVKGLYADSTWNKAELLALWMGALSANQSHRIVDLGKG